MFLFCKTCSIALFCWWWAGRLRRETLNYTQAYVASKLGISQNAYSKIESGQTNFSVKRLYEIVHILEANVVDFIQ